MSRDYKFLRTLFYLLGVDESTRPIKLDELFAVKYCQIQRYKVIKPIKSNGELWQVPLDRIPFSILRLNPGQIIYVRDDIRQKIVDISYTFSNTEQTASIERTIFEKLMPNLYLLPANKFRGRLGSTVSQIYKYYRMNKI